MTGRRYAVGQAVCDRDRQAHGHVVGLYPSPLVTRLADSAGFQWVARTVPCEPAGPQPAAGDADRVALLTSCGSGPLSVEAHGT